MWDYGLEGQSPQSTGLPKFKKMAGNQNKEDLYLSSMATETW